MRTLLLFISSLLFVASCGQQTETESKTTESTTNKNSVSQTDETPKEINVYSYRKEDLILPMLIEFENETGIKVNLVTGKADALLQRLESEGERSPADILITADAGRLYRAKASGLLQAVHSDILISRIPQHLRDSESQWFGLSKRSRVIFYNKANVTADELSSYEDLADEKWKGKICIRSSNNIYNQSLMASMIAHHGEEQAKAWALGVVNNMARSPKGNDRDQMKGAAIGVCDIAIANTYYYGKWLASDKQIDKENSEKIAVFYPNANGRGAHINISGVGVTKHAKNKEGAIKLIEFLTSDKAQQFYASSNYEYPVVTSTPVSDLVKSWGYPFKEDNLSLEALGENNPLAIKLFDQVGWK